MRRHFRLTITLILVLIALARPATSDAAPNQATLPKVDLVMWYQDSQEAMNDLGIQQIFATWASVNAPGSTLTLIQKADDDLVPDFQAAATQGSGSPDLLWTAADSVSSFVASGLLQPLDDVVDMRLFMPTITNSVRIAGKTYGIPVQAGNEIVLYYNKKFVTTAPKTYDELITLAAMLQQANAGLDGFTAFSFNEDDLLWAYPIAHAFGATLFAADGKTPALDSEGWVKALQFLHDLKFKAKIVPEDCDYQCLDGGFKAGTTALILNGDWALTGSQGYLKLLGDNLGVAAWPSVGTDPAQSVPASFIVGEFILFPASTGGDKLKTAAAFAKYLTTDEPTALSWTVPNKRLPALLSALKNDQITTDPILAQTSMALSQGLVLPTGPAMDCIQTAMYGPYRDVTSDSTTAIDAAKAAQKSAADCIAKLNVPN